MNPAESLDSLGRIFWNIYSIMNMDVEEREMMSFLAKFTLTWLVKLCHT